VLLYQLVSSSLFCGGSRGVPVASNASCAVVIFKIILSAFSCNDISGHFSPQDPMLSSIHLETSNAYKWQCGLPPLTLAMGHCEASPEVEALPIPPHARARDLSTKTSSQHSKLRGFTSCRRTKVRSELLLGVVAQDLNVRTKETEMTRRFSQISFEDENARRRARSRGAKTCSVMQGYDATSWKRESLWRWWGGIISKELERKIQYKFLVYKG